MDRRRMMATVLAGGGATPVEYILLDTFLTDDSAPLSSPRNCEPGPGVITLVQNDGSFAAASQIVTVTAQSTPAANDLRFYSGAIPREAGISLIAKVKAADTSTEGNVGFDKDTAGGYANRLGLHYGSFIVGNNAKLSNTISTYANTQIWFEVAVILRTAGAFYFLRGGTYTEWTLIYVDSVDVSANAYAIINSLSLAMTIDARVGYRVVDLGGVFATAYDLAVLRLATTTDGQTATAAADGFLEYTLTAQTGVDQDIMFRRTDDDNTWIARQKQTTNQILLIEKSGGTETIRATTSGIFLTNATAYRMMVKFHKTDIRVLLNWDGAGGAKAVGAYASATFNLNATGVKVSNAGTNLIVWPYLYNLGTTYSTRTRNFISVGDSKASPGTFTLENIVSISDDGQFNLLESPPLFGHPGYTTQNLKDNIDADILAARYLSDPEWALINIGVNDGSYVEATFKANLLYVIDALHTKWPSMQIFVARIWARGADALMNTVDGYIDYCIAQRPDIAFAGVDERIVIKAADNGVTYSTDGVHPNAAGGVVMATAWRTLMGL